MFHSYGNKGRSSMVH